MDRTETTAIIDIGSNSVRLVVYAGPRRIPTSIFNEKVLAGLGSGSNPSGSLPAKPRERALAALRRFRLLIDQMQVASTRVVATAAIRDAADGADFVRAVEAIGFDCEVLSAAAEAHYAGEGVLSGIPAADGTAGDLGGGSLELVDVADGTTRPGISLPLGVLRLDVSENGARTARKVLRDALDRTEIRERAKGRGFYMVGGSWRALARIDMLACDFPLPIAHQYSMDPARAGELCKLLPGVDSRVAKAVAASRVASLPVAAMLLQLLVEELDPSELIVSSYGIREGLLYAALDKAERAIDPLITETREAGSGALGFGQHGDLLDAWMAPLFDDPPRLQRLRLAACLLADLSWQANPGFRADHAVEMALHGNWVAVSPAERVLMAQALSSSSGQDRLTDARLAQLCDKDDLRRARDWGLAMRLGQRLSGSVGAILERTRLSSSGGLLQLHVAAGEDALVSDTIERRLLRLGEALQLEAAVVTV